MNETGGFEKVTKGLHCHAEGESCSGCPYRASCKDYLCESILMKDALKLLEEQKQRIDGLKTDIGILEGRINYHNCNTCGRNCTERPNPGELVRTNCFMWIGAKQYGNT